jgi:RNA polymerase sigma factor (sigma-70 family)
MVPAGSARQNETGFEVRRASGLWKIRPAVKPPGSNVLASLSAAEARRLLRRLREPVECVFNPVFEQPEAERVLLAALEPAAIEVPADVEDSGADLLGVGRIAVLTPEQERAAFLQLNYCRYRVLRIVQDFAGRRLSLEAARQVLEWDRRAAEARELIVRVNLPLVLAMAKRTRVSGVDFSDLISEGNLALMRAVEKFDCSRGYKFSTYACRAILKSFSRVAARYARYRGQFPTEFDPLLEKGDFLEQKRADVEEDCIDELKDILRRNLARLSEVEQRVIRARFALGPSNGLEPVEAKTLEQVGQMIGVTKERVRQIQNHALSKLRAALESGILAG